MNYEDMSDFEINVLVTKVAGLLVKESFEDGLLGFTERYHSRYPNTVWTAKQDNGKQTDAWEQMNFCAHPEDIMPLVIERRIRINPLRNDRWRVSSGFDAAHDKNPYRAAAIVILMMENKL